MKEFFRLIRLPNLIVIALFQCLLRYAYIIPNLTEENVAHTLPTYLFILTIISSVCLAAGGNAINDYFDIKTDRINRPQTIVVDKTIDRRSVLLTHVLLTLVGLFAGLYVSFVLRKAALMLTFIAVPILLWFYSTHFKKQILVGNIVVALLVALSGYLVVCVEYAAIDRSARHIITDDEPFSTIWYVVCAYCTFAFAANLAREIIKDMEDIEGDSQTRCHTLAVELGCDYSKIVVYAVLTAVLLCIGAALWQFIPDMHNKVLLAYVGTFIFLPTFYLIFVVARAKSKKDFHKASTISKVIMLLGVLSLLLI